MHMRAYLLLTCLLCLPAPQVRSQQTEAPAQSSGFSQAQFVPDISVILDCSYLHRNIRDAENETLLLPGFPAHGEHEGMHNGFNLNYAELSFTSIVDPYFELVAICHLSPEHVHLEEAYWFTRRLPGGLQLTAGKFLSGFGRLNQRHAHEWDFADRPLVLNAFFGDEGLNEIGARANWVAPIPTYLMVGAELLMGDNEASFGRTGFACPDHQSHVDDARGPALVVGYLESSLDMGTASLLGRLSAAHGTARHDDGLSRGDPGAEAFSGKSTLFGAALTLRHTFDAVRSVSVQSEYLWRSTDGTRYSVCPAGHAHESTAETRQSGFYAQAVAAFALRWRAGVRLDILRGNDVTADGLPMNLPEDLPRYAAMLEFNPTEFSRIRLQYTHDRAHYTASEQGLGRNPVHQLMLQVNLAIGAHTAHAF